MCEMVFFSAEISDSLKFAQDLACMSAEMFAQGKVNRNSVKFPQLEYVCRRIASAFSLSSLSSSSHTHTHTLTKSLLGKVTFAEKKSHKERE